jgi:hypothetical protein
MIRYAVVDGVIQQVLAVYVDPELQILVSLRNDGSRSLEVVADTVYPNWAAVLAVKL